MISEPNAKVLKQPYMAHWPFGNCYEHRVSGRFHRFVSCLIVCGRHTEVLFKGFGKM